MIDRYCIRQPVPLSQLIGATLTVIGICVPVAGRAGREGLNQLPEAAATSRAIEDPRGEAMRAFYESLMRTEDGRQLGITRIVHYGDSHVAADLLTGELRRRFQIGFGDSGPGFFAGGRPWKGYAPRAVRSTASAGWEIGGIGSAERDRRFGLAGVSLESSRSGEWIRVEADCRHFEIYFLKQPAGGAVEVILDAQTYCPWVSLASEGAAPAYIDVNAWNDGSHSVEIRIISAGPVRLLGLIAENSNAGVTYDALGINGARADRLLGWDWKVFANNLAHRNPNLIIVAYGSNEAGDTGLDLEQYGRSFTAVLGRLRAAVPNASLLVISPPDRSIRVNGGWQSIGRMQSLVAAQRRAALDAGAAFWDFFSAMGGAGSIQRWASRTPPLAQADRVHLTREGYKLEAEMLYAELMRGYLWEVALRGDGR